MLKSLLFKTFILSFCCIIPLTAAYAMEEEKEKEGGKIIEKPQRREQPRFELLQNDQLPGLFDRAKKGDREAQNQVIQRNYWGFLNRGACIDSWMFMEKNLQLNVPDWEDIERRAMDDDQYAYTLINAYADLLRSSPSNKPFTDKFPDLFRSLHEKADTGDACAQFNLGVVYHQFRGRGQLGLQMKSSPMEITDQWLLKAAAQDHPHAQVTLGFLCARGASFADVQFGRNPVAALGWFYASKDTKTSQENIKSLVVRQQPQRPQQEGSFHEELKKIKSQLNSLLGEHSLQAGIHHPEGTFPDHQFAIPELSTRYTKVVRMEEQALNILTSLENSRPGFMITQVMVGGANKEEIGRMISRRSQPPFVAIHDIKGVSYLTLEQENVTIAAHFLAYLEEIDEKFSKADKVLKKEGKSYQRRLDIHLDELKETRLLCLAAQKAWQKDRSDENKKKLDEAAKRFNEQEQKYEDKKLLLKPTIKKIKEERDLLAMVKEDMKTLIPELSALRNLDFTEDNPYLK